MVIRAWLVVGILVIGVAWYLTVIAPPPTIQASARTAISDYRQAGLMPAAGALKQSTAIGHDVFELPAADAEHLKEEQASQMVTMPGMNMGEGDQADAMPGMAMDRPGEQQAMQMQEGAATGSQIPMQMGDGDAKPGAADQAMQGMKMDSTETDAEHDEKDEPMKGMAMDRPDEEQAMQMQDGKAPGSQMPMQMGASDAKPEGAQAMKMESAKTGAEHDEKDEPMKGMAMDRPDQKQTMQLQGMNMAEAVGGDDHADDAARPEGDAHAEEEAEGGHRGGGGIELVSATADTPVDRTIEVKMTEWGYTPSQVMVKPGEVVRFVVTNAGNIPHEFMIMTGPGMASVGYRIQRADWNLTEHEAIYENPLVMPGDTFETVLKIDQPGSWMFMCMFPFHMQMGMMGMMMTEGMAGTNMGGMKM